jgi:CheY-like chemotaxis protein
MMQSPYIRTLLQVDDNRANAELIIQFIARRSDLRLLTATSGQQGVEMACSHLPDVILMDIVMPDMDGHEAFQRLRQNPATARIPVIALSSNAYKVEIKQCLDAGFFCYVTKPYKLNELMATIDAALKCVEGNRPATS